MTLTTEERGMLFEERHIIQGTTLEEDQEHDWYYMYHKMDWSEGRSLAGISSRQITMAEDRP